MTGPLSRLTGGVTLVAAVGMAVLLATAATAPAADWPQYGYDAGRTAACPQALPANLRPKWVLELPAPRPAFPGNPQLAYDVTYEPVVLGKTMFVPSMVTDSVTALDTETGRTRWRFFAEGPVRFAPAARDGNVYIVSDDGYLYCLNAADGALRWKVRGLPEGRTDRKVIGDGRLISIFPARGGPVLADGIVYFAAGIWSDEGVFVHAVDAETGRLVWSNTTSGRVPHANPDHGVGGETGISPQGHLAIVNDVLVVPCGSQLPALLNRKTGKLYTYTMGWGGKFQQPNGSVFVSGVGKYLIQTGDLFDLGSVGKGPSLNDPDQNFREIRMQMIHVGGLPRLQADPAHLKKGIGQFRKPVLTPEAMYCQENGIVAFDLTKPRTRETADAGKKGKRFADEETVVFPELWRLPGKSRVHIKAGDRLYCAGPGRVEAVDIPAEGQTPKVSWQAKVQGTPHRLLAADDKLFVVTLEGRIYAFAGGVASPMTTHEAPAPDPTAGAGATPAAGILRAAGIADGYILMLGLTDPALAEGFVRASKCDVIAVEPDAAKAAGLRERFQRARLYGPRISVLTGDPTAQHLPPYFASLIVLGNPDVVAKAGDPAFVGSLFRSLRPYGGACLGLSPAALRTVSTALAAGKFPGGAIVRLGGASALVRQGPLAGTTDWSHDGANAANTGASEDKRIRPPLTRLWFTSADQWVKKLTSVRIAGGRLLVCADELYALDVYTGRHLWQAAYGGSDKVVALKDAIYVPGRTCAVLDPVTGKTIREIAFPGDARSTWSAMRVLGNVIVAASDNRLVRIDRDTGKVLWTHQCANTIGDLAVGGGKVFCTDALNPRRSGRNAGPAAGTVTALAAQGGKVLWRVGTAGAVLYSQSHDVLFVGTGIPRGEQSNPRFNSAYPIRKFTAYRGVDGTPLWTGLEATHAFVVGDRLIAYLTQNTPKHALVTVHDLLTGKKLADDIEWYQRGCTVLRAGASMLTTRYEGNAAYYDLASGKMTPISNVRAACSNNLYPADGVLLAPSLIVGCVCNYLPVSQAFVPSWAVE